LVGEIEVYYNCLFAPFGSACFSQGVPVEELLAPLDNTYILAAYGKLCYYKLSLFEPILVGVESIAPPCLERCVDVAFGFCFAYCLNCSVYYI